MNLNQKLKVSEIFYSLQGEGGRAGKPTVFIRLSGCSIKNACFKSGVFCDTEFESNKEMTLFEIIEEIKQFPSNEITWTGGEPLDQLNEGIIKVFKSNGFYQAIETSGGKRIPSGFDYICVSPKVAEHIVKRNIQTEIDELRYVRHKGQPIPTLTIKAKRNFLSPHSDGNLINKENLNHCIMLCKNNPEWSLSLQMHKIFDIL